MMTLQANEAFRTSVLKNRFDFHWQKIGKILSPKAAKKVANPQRAGYPNRI
jgi:hypothetical protein